MPDLKELVRLYNEAEEVDKGLWAEQRTNVLLVASEHYNKRAARFYDRLRDDKRIDEQTRIRLTRNHIQKITKGYVNGIVRQAPNVIITAANELDAQDQKSAELHRSVKKWVEKRQKWRKRRREFAKSFVDIGEVFVKVYWDDNGGVKMLPRTPPQTMVPEGAEQPPPVESMSGEICWDEFYGFNVMRPKSAKSIDKSPWLGLRSMVAIKDLQAMVKAAYPEAPDLDEKLKLIEQAGQDTYTVFDGSNGNYMNVKGQCMLREWYYRPCSEYKNGWYCYWTEKGILFEGELPEGIFPIICGGFGEIATSPRCYSIIKVARPYQMQLNLAGSKQAEHIVTLGDDKVYIRHGSKLTPGATLPGIRTSTYSGALPPTITPGSTGAQFVPYGEAIIEELYDVCDMVEEREETNEQVDPKTQLLRLMRQKKKTAYYGEKFEDFITELWDVTLRLFKAHVTEEALVHIVGKKEQLNIAELKNLDDSGYQLNIEPMSDDPETKMGTQMAIDSVLQYVGSKLEKEDIGKFVRLSPYLNKEEMFRELTLDYDGATNDILALDRGQVLPINREDNHAYMLKRLNARKREPDFLFLSPEIQNLYAQKVEAHQMLQAQIAEQLQRAQSGFIPADGPLVTCDFYVEDPSDPSKQRRLRVPSSALNWLVKKLKDQGAFMGTMSSLPPNVLADIGAHLKNPVGEPSQSEVPDDSGAENPGGASPWARMQAGRAA